MNKQKGSNGDCAGASQPSAPVASHPARHLAPCHAEVKSRNNYMGAMFHAQRISTLPVSPRLRLVKRKALHPEVIMS